MKNALSRSKSAFFHPTQQNHTSTPSSRFNKPHPPLPNVQNTPVSPPPVPFTCPMPCALHDHSSRTSTPAPASSSGTVRSAKSIFFEPRRTEKSKPSIDDEETYCVLSDEGVEVLAKGPEDNELDQTLVDRMDMLPSAGKGSRALKRTPSIGNLLKTPSRLNLRKMPSKMRLFSDTPSSVESNNTAVERSFAYSKEAASMPAAANTPTSNKSSRSSKSFLRRAVFKDKTEKLMTRGPSPFHDVSEHPLPGTVASRVKAMEDTYRRSLIVEGEPAASSVEIEAARSASVPLLSRAGEPVTNDVIASKTPRSKWLNKLHIGKSSTKRKTRLEIPSFADSPGLAERVEKELKHRSQEQEAAQECNKLEPSHNPTLLVQVQPPEHEELNRASSIYPSPLATPVLESPPMFDRLSVAVSPHFVSPNQNHTFTFGTRSSATSYFGNVTTSDHQLPHQALVASSPLSGDLHISHSPARNAIEVVDRLNVSFRHRETQLAPDDGDVTGRFSIFSFEEREKVTQDRPKSDPIPLKHIAQANNELRTLLESFEDTFAYDIASINTSVAPGTKHSYFASPAPPTRTFSPRKQDDEIPDDLQHLLNGAVQLNEVLRVSEESERPCRPISMASSFEGNVTTAQDAISMNAGRNVALPKIVETPTVTFEWVAAANIEGEHERVSSDLDRRDSFSCSTNSTRSSMDGPHEQLVGDTGLPGPRPSFDSGRSSFDQPDEDASSYHPRPKLDKYLSSCSGVSNRSSLRDYLAMERPGLGDRMLQEVDEDVVLDPISDPHLLNAQRASFASSVLSSVPSKRDSSGSIGLFQTARTSNLPYRFSSTSESDGTGSIAHSPTPANGLRRVLNRHSMECDVGDQSRRSLEFSLDSHGSPIRRTYFDSQPSSPVSELGRAANETIVSNLPSLSIVRKSTALMAATSNAIVKQSTQSSLFSLSSVNSSPCPRPPRRKLLMLTGNRLPRPPPAEPVFAAPAQTASVPLVRQTLAKLRPSMSPQQGRVRRLKDSWEAKISPKKNTESPLASSASPRFVRPIPETLDGKAQIPRPQPLSNLSTNGTMIPPDTPPPSSPSASELSFASTSRSSVDYTRGNGVQGRLANFGRRRVKGHKRQSSQLSRHSVLAEPIQEEVTATIQLETIKSESPASSHNAPSQQSRADEPEYSDYTSAYDVLDSYLEEESQTQEPALPSPPPKSVSPLVIRKTRSQTSLASERSLHLGLDAFQSKSQQFIKPKKSARQIATQEVEEIGRDPVVIVGDDASYLEELEAHSQLKWTRFCHEALLELQKSRTLFPDTDATHDIYDSPLSSNSSNASSIYASPLIQAFSTPGSGLAPDLTSPLHQSAIVSIILDSQARYKSDIDKYDSCSSLDMPSTPELSPDRSEEPTVLQGHGMSENTLPSPMHIKRLSYRPINQMKRTSYQPKSLLLVQKHLSIDSTAVLGQASAKPAKASDQAKVAPEPVHQALTKKPLQQIVNQSGLPKSTKGYKPRVQPGSPKKTAANTVVLRKPEPIVKPLTPGKRIRAIAKNRTLQEYADEVLAGGDSAASGDAGGPGEKISRQAINSFLPGRKLSQRRNDAFTAARRKLEGVGDPSEQTDRSSGGSSTDEADLYKTGLGNFSTSKGTSAAALTSRDLMSKVASGNSVLEASGGSTETVRDARSSGLFGMRGRPRPPTRRTALGLVRTMR